MGTILNGTSAITEAERQRLSTWNNTRTHYPRNQCIHQLFEQEAERRPEGIALRFRDQTMSYRELNQRANRVAHRLRKMGVGPEVMVGTLLERSFEMVVGILGILKAGGAFVPLDAGYPAERLTFMAADTQAPVMLVQDRVAGKIADASWCKTRVLSLDSELCQINQESDENLPNLTTAENLAYVMYTSGSTGQPKGVMVNHQAVVRLVKNTNYVELSEREVVLQFSPISFDASTFEIWGALLNGGCLALVPPDQQSLEDLGQAISQHEVSIAWLTAGLFNLVVEQRLESLRPLRQLLVGGDALSPAHVKQAMAGLPNCQLINGYGPTEGTTFTCCRRISRQDAESSSIPIGKPISNTQVLLLDADGELAPIGEAAELCVAGDGLARGYLNQPELTAAKFVAHPLSENTGDRIYKTGDLARYRSDGTIEFLGRIDNQVKISGYRIEPGEIEAALMQHSDVRSAVVVARQDGPGEKKLVAYIVAWHDACSIPKIRSFLQQKLPVYMLPAAFVRLDALPLSPNGKVDRAALPAPVAIASEPAAPLMSAQTELEPKVEAVWLKVLGVSHVGADDNFFDIGGDSLQLLLVHAELQKAIDPDLPITDLFEHSTIRSLARHLAGGAGDEGMAAARQRARLQQMAWAQHKRSKADQNQ